MKVTHNLNQSSANQLSSVVDLRQIDSETFNHTKHSQVRMHQRGISQDHIDLIVNYADQCEYAGSGAERLAISRKLGHRLVKSGAISAKQYGRVKNIVLIADGSDLITLFRRSTRLKRLN